MEDWALIADHVDCYNVAPVYVRTRAIVSQRASLCTASHDVADISFPMTSKPIEIGASSWIASEAFVGPGVRVAEGAVLGARGAAFGDLEAWTIYRGNPAAPIRKRRLNIQRAD